MGHVKKRGEQVAGIKTAVQSAVTIIKRYWKKPARVQLTELPVATALCVSVHLKDGHLNSAGIIFSLVK